jgi:hypothetical protein
VPALAAILLLSLLILLPSVQADASSSRSSETGAIGFGTDYTVVNSNFRLVNPKKSFGPTDTLAYVANIPGGAQTKKMAVVFYTQYNRATKEVSRHTWYVTNIHDTQFADTYSLSNELSYKIVKPGTYIMRFYRGTVLLAQGIFYRTK